MKTLEDEVVTERSPGASEQQPAISQRSSKDSSYGHPCIWVAPGAVGSTFPAPRLENVTTPRHVHPEHPVALLLRRPVPEAVGPVRRQPLRLRDVRVGHRQHREEVAEAVNVVPGVGSSPAFGNGATGSNQRA